MLRQLGVVAGFYKKNNNNSAVSHLLNEYFCNRIVYFHSWLSAKGMQRVVKMTVNTNNITFYKDPNVKLFSFYDE